MALPVYDKDVKIPVVVIGKRGQAPDTIVEGERITVGTWEIISYPQVRFSQVRERRYNLIDRAQQRAKLDLMAEEDRNIFNAVDRSSTILNPETLSGSTTSRDALVSGLAEVGKWDLVPAKFIMNYSEFADIMKFGRDQFDPVKCVAGAKFGYIGETPYKNKDNTEGRLAEKQEPVETTRQTSNKDEDIVRSIQQCIETNRNDLSIDNINITKRTQREVLQTGLVGHLWTLDLMVSKVVPRGTIWVIAEPEFTGVIPIRQDVNVIPKNCWGTFKELNVDNPLYAGNSEYAELLYNSENIQLQTISREVSYEIH